MQIIRDSISIDELKKMSGKMFNRLVKAVVDIELQIMVVDAEFHSDEESILLDQGSKQEHLWGINLYPDKLQDQNWIEFDSMINLRPSWGNNTRSVDDQVTQEKIRNIVNKLVIK